MATFEASSLLFGWRFGCVHNPRYQLAFPFVCVTRDFPAAQGLSQGPLSQELDSRQVGRDFYIDGVRSRSRATGLERRDF